MMFIKVGRLLPITGACLLLGTLEIHPERCQYQSDLLYRPTRPLIPVPVKSIVVVSMDIIPAQILAPSLHKMEANGSNILNL